MDSNLRALIVTACTLLAALGPAVPSSHAQQVNGVIGSYYPTQLARGTTTVLHVALGRNNPVQSIEITPSAGITVTATNSRDLNQGSVWWEFTLNVARDAAPGPRTLVAVQQMGRTAPVTLMIPDHSPNISNPRVVSAQLNQPTIDVQLAASDPGGSFGESPYVWFLLSCGPGQPEAGVVHGTMQNGTIRASIPNPRTLAGHAGAPSDGNHCDLQTRVTDASNADSNTTTVAFDFK
jgi:hypothetical protein